MTSRNLHSEKGFSLMELLIVVTIIGILAAVATPAYISHVRKTRQADGIHRILDIKTAQEKFYALNDTYAASIAALGNMITFDANDITIFSFTISDTSNLTTTFTALSQNDINEDTTRRDCWSISSPPSDLDGDGNVDSEPTQITGVANCTADGEGVNISLF